MDQQPNARPVVRRARGIQRIASILDAAETVFARIGYDEATTHHIAAQAGISPGSLYQFFANKEAIAKALVVRYAEELQRVYSTVFSLEAATLPFSQWIDQIVDALITFHLTHEAFHALFDAPPSLEVAGLTQQLPLELQTRLELGFQVRAPRLPAAQRRLSATLVVQLFRAVPRQILQVEEAERQLLVSELKTLLHRYLEPYFG
jgi:AcrR family transcriptional regulator